MANKRVLELPTITNVLSSDYIVVDRPAGTSNVQLNSIASYISSSLSINAVVPDDSITNAKMADNAISTAELSDNSVTTEKIVSHAITNEKLGFNSIKSGNIENFAITPDKLASTVVNSTGGIKLDSTTGLILNTNIRPEYIVSTVLSINDMNCIVPVNNSSSITITVPLDSSVNFPIGSNVVIYQKGSGQVTITGSSGVTLLSNYNKTKLSGQYSSASLYKISPNTWLLGGDLASNSGQDGYTGNRLDTLIVNVSGFDTNTAENDSTLVWDYTLKQFIATKRPNFVSPPAKSAIKFMGTCITGTLAVLAVTYENRIVYWGNDSNIIGGRATNIAPNNYARLKLLNNNGVTPTYEDYLSLEEKADIVVEDVQYGTYGAMVLLSDNTVWLNGDGAECKNNWEIANTDPLASTSTRGYFLKVRAPNNALYTKISYGGDNNRVYFNAMLLTSDKNVYMFGSNMNGMCGVGVAAGTNVDIISAASKVTNVNIAGKAVDIYSGSSELGVSYILTDANELWGAGNNTQGQLGQGDIVSKNSFVRISTNVRTFAKSPYSCLMNTFFIKTDGTIWGCGNNALKQLTGTTTTTQKSPVQITTTAQGNFVKIGVSGGTAAYITIIAMTDAGKVYTWGYNADGACGNGTLVAVTTPTLVNNPKTGQPLLGYDIIASRNTTNGNCFYVVGRDNMLYAAGYRAWTNTTNTPDVASSISFSKFYPFNLNIKRDNIVNFSIIDGADHYGLYTTTTDGHLFYKGISSNLQGSSVADNINGFAYVM